MCVCVGRGEKKELSKEGNYIVTLLGNGKGNRVRLR